MIVCKICNKQFKSIITNSHLKTHELTTDDYKLQYGIDSLSSEEFRIEKSKSVSGENNPMFGNRHTEEAKNLISEKKKGRVTRTGPITGQALNNLREGIKRREEKYNSGEMNRAKRLPTSNETKIKISKSIKKYAAENYEELSNRGRKAYITKVNNGTYKNFLPPWEELSEDQKNRMLSGLKKYNEFKTQRSHDRCVEKINELNLILLNNISENSLKLQCNICKTIFNFTRQVFTESKFNTELCPGCFPRDIIRSKAEEEIYSFVKTIIPNVISNDRTVINPLEIDIFIPELKIGFEYSGLYWHSESGNLKANRVKDFDNYKQKLAKDKGIQLYIIFEDEWENKREIVKSRICNILNVSNKKIYARDCNLKSISSKEANVFLQENHLQGGGRSNARYGLYYNDKLISVMTFSNNNISRKINNWEINRFCSKLDHTIVGGASKLFKRFLTDYNPKEVISYADSRWSNGDLYKILGFNFVHKTHSNYWYFRPNELIRKHRYGFRKNKNDNPNLTEYENRLNEGYLRIWDCGSTKWCYNNIN
jgi:hypothetical protein